MSSTGTRSAARAHALGLLAAAAPLVLCATAAGASVTISGAATKHMQCSGGTCSPTATNAVLNVSDLTSMLASGDATVTTTGSAEADNILVAASLSWSSAHTLTLTAHLAIAIQSPVSVKGKGGLALNDAGAESLGFYNGASVTFRNPSSALSINGNSYALVNTVTELASAAGANQNGFIALANSYDASKDGTYSNAPVQAQFNGIFEGLGNAISNLTVVDGTASGGCDGLAANWPSATINDLGMVNVSITSTGGQGANGAAGIVCGMNSGGLIWRSYATGAINMQWLDGAGGLTAGNARIVQCWTDVAISGTQGDGFGGLTVGGPSDLIQQSFSMGPLSCSGIACQLGGLAAGAGQGSEIVDSYSLSAVTDTSTSNSDGASLGGLISGNGGNSVAQSYAAGKITSPSSGCANGANCVGGLYGTDTSNGNTDVYWDTTTVGVGVAAGNEASDPGTKGLTNKKLIAKLPKGFDRKIWAEDPKINHGLPYLKANPPPQ